MSTALIIAIPVLLILAAVMIIATGRRRAASDPEGHVTGTLSAETRQTDQSVGTPDRGRRHVRRGARAGRRDPQGHRLGRRARPRRGAPPPSWRGPAVDEEELGISRRQFFNRGILVTMAISLGAFGAAAISFLYATSAGGFGGSVDAGVALSDVEAYWASNKAPFYVPEARTYLQPYPKADVQKAAKIPQYATVLARHGAGHRGAVPEVRPPRLPGAVVPDSRSGSSAPATVRSTTGSARSRVARRRVASTTWSSASAARRSMIDTSGLPVTGPPIGTDTTGQGAEGPSCVGDPTRPAPALAEPKRKP